MTDKNTNSPNRSKAPQSPVRLTSIAHRPEKLREDCLRDLRIESYSSRDPHTVVENMIRRDRILEDVERFSGQIQDFTCYRIASKIDQQKYSEAHFIEKRREEGVKYEMHILSSWERLAEMIRTRVQQSADGSALVSLVLCHPGSVVLQDLRNSYAYLNLRSGSAWDLHFVGYRASKLSVSMAPSVLGIPQWQFDAATFLSIISALEAKHATSLIDPDSVAENTPWRFSGTADLVSFMAYRDLQGLIDWSSLRSIQLLNAQGNYIDRSLGQIVEIMSDWRDDGPGVRDFAPGEIRHDGVSVLELHPALTAIAGVIAGGVAGNTAYDLLKQILG